MALRTPLRVAFCCLLVVSLVATTAPAGAAPPPRPLCDACGESFEETVAERGVVIDDEIVTEPIDVDRSTATVRIHENGTAAWTVRNWLGDSPGTDRLRSNASYRDAVAESAMWDAEYIGANVSEDGVVELRYREPEFAEQSVRGTLRSGEFTSAYGYRNLHGLGADRLDVIAPDGYRVGWTVSGAAVDDDGSRMTLTELDDEGFVTFVPRDAALGALWSLLAVAGLVAPAAAANAFVGAVTPALLFGVVVGVAFPLFGRSGDVAAAADSALACVGLTVDRVVDVPGVGLAVVGAATTLAMLAIGAVGAVGPSLLPLVGVGIAYAILGAAISRRAVRERVSYRALTLLAAGGAIVAGVVTLGVATVVTGPTRWLVSGHPTLVPLFSLLPAGYALGRENRRLAAGTAAVAFAVGALTVTPVVAPRFWRVSALSVAAIANVFSVAVVGAPLLVVGAVLGRYRSAEVVDPGER